MSEKATINKSFLQKVAQFTKIAVERIHELEVSLQAQMSKEAAEKQAHDEYMGHVKTAAKALYDYDYFLDSEEQRDFISKAAEDQNHVAKTIIKLCKSAEVNSLGHTSNYSIQKVSSFNDPVYQAAFGRKQSRVDLD